MKRVYFEQWVLARQCSSHHEGKECIEWHQDMTDTEAELLQAQHAMMSRVGKAKIVRIEEIENGNG
jgi:hypothetical protein